MKAPAVISRRLIGKGGASSIPPAVARPRRISGIPLSSVARGVAALHLVAIGFKMQKSADAFGSIDCGRIPTPEVMLSPDPLAPTRALFDTFPKFAEISVAPTHRRRWSFLKALSSASNRPTRGVLPHISFWGRYARAGWWRCGSVGCWRRSRAGLPRPVFWLPRPGPCEPMTTIRQTLWTIGPVRSQQSATAAAAGRAGMSPGGFRLWPRQVPTTPFMTGREPPASRGVCSSSTRFVVATPDVCAPLIAEGIKPMQPPRL